MMSTDITPATKFLCLYIIRSSEEFAVDGNDWQGAFALSDGLCEEFDFQRWRDALIQDVVNGIKDGHIDAIALIDMAHATHTVVAFCDHLHFHLGVFSRYNRDRSSDQTHDCARSWNNWSPTSRRDRNYRRHFARQDRLRSRNDAFPAQHSPRELRGNCHHIAVPNRCRLR